MYACINFLLVCNMTATNLVACNKTPHFHSQKFRHELTRPQLQDLSEIYRQCVSQGWSGIRGLTGERVASKLTWLLAGFRSLGLFD